MLRKFFEKMPLGRRIAMTILSNRILLRSAFYRLIYLAYIRREAKRLLAQAPVVHMETTNCCNARCTMCSYPIMQRPRGFIDSSLYSGLLRQCSAWGVGEVNLQFLGEPLLDKDLFQRIADAKKAGLRVRLTTNASLLTAEMAKQLVESGIDHVFISMDGLTKETFESIRRGLRFEDVRRGIANLVEQRQCISPNQPRISLIFVGLAENSGEADAFVRYWRPQVDEVLVATARDWSSTVPLARVGEYLQPAEWRPPCRHLWEEMIVLRDGRVTPCCECYDAQIEVGDAHTQSLETIWNGERYMRLRELHLAGRAGEIPFCATCKVRTDWW